MVKILSRASMHTLGPRTVFKSDRFSASPQHHISAVWDTAGATTSVHLATLQCIFPMLTTSY